MATVVSPESVPSVPGSSEKGHSISALATSVAPRAFYLRRAFVELILAAALAVACGLLFWGSGFATNMVHDQLSDQKISFPAAGSPGFAAADFPSLQKYAGQPVDDGAKAKAYANDYIAVHLNSTAGGKTYSEMSTIARSDRAAATAAQKAGAADAAALDAKATASENQVQTLFRGETLRGLLLYAWGWWLVGKIAFWAAVAALVGAVLMFVLAAVGVVHARKGPALA
ncbi:MAG: hypothetical protein AB7L13_13440 [Acidimicrobiia bacterium]